MSKITVWIVLASRENCGVLDINNKGRRQFDSGAMIVQVHLLVITILKCLEQSYMSWKKKYALVNDYD